MAPRLLALMGIALALAVSAQAATLIAGPLRIDNDAVNGDVLECSVVNVSTDDVEVFTMAVLEDSQPCGPFILAPGSRTVCQNGNNGVTSALGHCSFEVSGGKKKVRASACALDQNFNCRAALPGS